MGKAIGQGLDKSGLDIKSKLGLGLGQLAGNCSDHKLHL